MTRKKPAKPREDDIKVCRADIDDAVGAAVLRSGCFEKWRQRLRVTLGSGVASDVFPMDDVSTIAAVLGSSEYTSFVAKDGEAVIGFLSVKGSGYVFSLCVAPEYRRKRVATRMVEAYLKDSAAKWIYADATTESFGAPARAFYESLGMKAVPFMRYVRRI